MSPVVVHTQLRLEQLCSWSEINLPHRFLQIVWLARASSRAAVTISSSRRGRLQHLAPWYFCYREAIPLLPLVLENITHPLPLIRYKWSANLGTSMNLPLAPGFQGPQKLPWSGYRKHPEACQVFKSVIFILFRLISASFYYVFLGFPFFLFIFYFLPFVLIFIYFSFLFFLFPFIPFFFKFLEFFQICELFLEFTILLSLWIFFQTMNIFQIHNNFKFKNISWICELFPNLWKNPFFHKKALIL